MFSFFSSLKKIFRSNSARESSSESFQEREGLCQLSPLTAGERGQEALHLPRVLGKKGGWVSSINTDGQMPEHTPHSPQLESPAERILPVSSALGTHRSLLEQKSRGGYCWRGGERKQGRKTARERTGIASGLLQPGHNGAPAWMEMVASPPSWSPSGLCPREVKGEEKLQVSSTVWWNTHHSTTPLCFLLFL